MVAIFGMTRDVLVEQSLPANFFRQRSKRLPSTARSIEY